MSCCVKAVCNVYFIIFDISVYLKNIVCNNHCIQLLSNCYQSIYVAVIKKMADYKKIETQIVIILENDVEK